MADQSQKCGPPTPNRNFQKVRYYPLGWPAHCADIHQFLSVETLLVIILTA